MAGESLNLNNLIELVIAEIEKRNAGRFNAALSFLKSPLSRFFVKPKSQPLSEFSMVLKAHHYYLCHYFPTMELIHQAAMLIHESVHDKQHQEMGSLKFFAKYATFKGRYEIELEAFKEEFRWYWSIGWLMDPIKLYRFADFMVDKYKRNYVTLWWFNEERQRQMKSALLSIVDKNPNV